MLPRIKTGESVSVNFDGATKSYSATVNYISTQAEFTPPVLYNRENRAKLIFMIEQNFLRRTRRIYGLASRWMRKFRNENQIQNCNGNRGTLDSGRNRLFVFPFSHQPRAGKSLDEIGISISKNQLADVGYGTPEAALETRTWAMANTNYDKMLESVTPEIRAMRKKIPAAVNNLRPALKRVFSSVEKLHILASKKVRRQHGGTESGDGANAK